ncbi:actin, cytoplasmic [Plakobranchus ocellatus]|uniref:Actin, cytoplasmic n=1 Tax=Plakobranchus ocellatus TaxID=259542 RepID=A0AAV4BFX8_9GAST|nr:actin, cytoplasmic [Plakobranchus ocellatus]
MLVWNVRLADRVVVYLNGFCVFSHQKMAFEHKSPIVMDVGGASCKIGFAGDDDPKCVLPTIVGKPKHQFGESRQFVGYEAQNKKALLSLTSPVQRGIVTDWDDMRTIWEHVFKDEFTVKIGEHPVLVTDTPENPKTNREEMAQVLFETYQVPSLFVAYQAVLSLYSAGRTTGLVLDIGHGVTTAVPVYEGYSVNTAVRRNDFAGQDLTEMMMKALTDRDYRFVTSSSRIDAQSLKERNCYVSDDYQKELESQGIKDSLTYELPDGRKIPLGDERIKIPEALFVPELAGRPNDHGLPRMVQEAVQRCEVDTRRQLYKNIILSGGSSLFPGLKERLKKEVAKICPFAGEAQVIAPENRLLSAWTGGSILAALSTFETMWVDRKDYEEAGPEALHKKCF